MDSNVFSLRKQIEDISFRLDKSKEEEKKIFDMINQVKTDDKTVPNNEN